MKENNVKDSAGSLGGEFSKIEDIYFEFSQIFSSLFMNGFSSFYIGESLEKSFIYV